MNKEWFVIRGTQHIGPFSNEEIEELYRNGEINLHTLIWKEGIERFETLFQTPDFQTLFKKKGETQIPLDLPPTVPHIPTLPKVPREVRAEKLGNDLDDDLPPPIPLSAILDPSGTEVFKKSEETRSRNFKLLLSIGSTVFILLVGWLFFNSQNSDIHLKIKGLMPVYVEKLERQANSKSNNFEVALALSLDNLSLWASTNSPDKIPTLITLKSIPKRVLGAENVTVVIRGELENHQGHFTRMAIIEGSKFLPGEYSVHVEAHKIHFLNQNVGSLAQFPIFKSLNRSYTYNGKTLIYSGLPRDFEKKLSEFSERILGEMLKPYQEKLERIQTFESILNGTSQNYFMVLEKLKTGKEILQFEAKFIKEISPILQALVLKAVELSNDPKYNDSTSAKPLIAPYSEQVLIGKQLGEMASDMITKTRKLKNLTDKDKTHLREEFDLRAKSLKLQIDLNIKRLQDQIQRISL